MSLTNTEYTDLFTCLGKFLKAINQFRNMAGGYSSPVPNLKNLFDMDLAPTLTAKSRYDTLDGLLTTFDSFKDAAVGWGATLGNYTTKLLTNRMFVIEKLTGLGQSPSTEDVLKELIRDMVKNGRTIQKATVSSAVSSYAASNAGNGVVLITNQLDGVSPPSLGLFAHELYNDVATELSATETMVLVCDNDEPSGNRPSGEETFALNGQPTSGGVFGWRTEGSGIRTNLTTLNAYQIVNNKDFNVWASDVPAGWTLDAGLSGTHIIEETASNQVFRGDSALKFVGDGVQTTHQISQTIATGLIEPGRMYCLSVMIKGGGNASGSLTIQFESASGGYNAATSTTGGVAERIVLTATALDALTTYSQRNFFFIAPSIIPDDLRLVLKVTGTLGNGEVVRLDSLSFGPVTYANGIGIAVIAGSNAWMRNDRIELAVANNNAGIFQDLFRRKYGIQLPSSASPTISDSLAT